MRGGTSGRLQHCDECGRLNNRDQYRDGCYWCGSPWSRNSGVPA